MNKTLLATSALALIAAQASAVDVELYGQVNKAVIGYDDGLATDFVVVDNDLSSTRFGVKGAQALDNGLTASVLFEVESQSNDSSAFQQAAGTSGAPTSVASTVPAVAGAALAERQARVGLSGNFGGVYVGRQNTAIDGLLETDLAGAQDVMTADYASIGGNLLFRNDNINNTLTGTTVAGLSQGIANSRADSVRYDSPIVAGFQGRLSVAQGGDTEAAVVYEGGVSDFKLAGSLGYRLNNDAAANAVTIAGRTDSNLVAAGSVAHSSGIAATLAYTSTQIQDKTGAETEPSSIYAKVGYTWDAFEVAADYGVSEHFNSLVSGNEDQLTAMGLAAQYNLGNGVSLAALYRNYDADISAATTTESIDLVGVNMRVKF